MKHKHCHGALDQRPLHATKKPQAGALTMGISGLPGLPGFPEHVIAVAQPRDPSKRRPDNPAGSPGKYEVTFLFSRPSTAVPEREISFEPNFEGDSHIQWAMKPPPDSRELLMHIAVTHDGGAMEFDLRTNPQGRLARADTHPFHADGFQAAEDKAYRALAPTLSHWSAELDVPLQVCRVFTRELATESRRVSYHSPFATVTFSAAGIGRVGEELRFYLSLYREGLASNSAPYQFLCFYKVVEGIRLRRVRLDQELIKAGGTPARLPERIPGTNTELEAWLNGLFRVKRQWDELSLGWTVPTEARGKKVGNLFEMLTGIRNNIAHALTEAGEPGHTADEQLNSPELNKWLPLVRCVARWMIKNDFPSEFLAGA